MKPAEYDLGVRCPAPCRKVRFANRRAEKRAARRMVGQGVVDGHLNIYRCGEFFHVGHLPKAVVSGDIARSDIRRPS